ncbi:MAG: PQQ-like beta-propeller repeat protein, partial [Candidatus Rokubacteria bacterium]|nr:PQQ-like beta-propeller repeat protein [Candidatus Rokubacteria bacterium]
AFDRRLDPHRWAFDLNGHQKWSTTTGGQADPFAQFQAQLAVGPNGTVYHTNLIGTLGWSVQAIRPTDGSVLWTYYQFPGNDYSPPDVGPGGTIYVARNLSFLDALNPNGTLLWEFSDGSIVDQPIASPAGDIVFAGGRPNFGMPGFIRAYSTVTGQPLWSLDLGTANGGNAILYSRSRFTSDGSAVYFGTAILGQSSINPFSYLYAIDTTATPPAFLMTLTLDATTVVGAMPSTGTVTLSAPAPSGGVVVTLTSSNTAVASVPPSVTVAAGQSSETFTVTTFNIGITTTSTISGYYNGGTASSVLTVTAGPTQAKLSSVSLSPTTVTGGSTATGTVRLTGPAPAGGAIVRLSSSKPRVAAVPASVTVPAGATSATFTVTTKRATATTALIRGSFGGVSRQATLTVTRGDAVLSP